MPKLTLVMERTPLQTYDLNRPIVRIGRGEGMEIVIDNVSVSREQAEIRQDGRRWSIRDLGSANGTFVNGERLAETRVLKAGDEISFGKFSLFFDRPLDAPAATPVTITPDQGRGNAPGTYLLTAEDLERLQQRMVAKRQAQLQWGIAGVQGTFFLKTDTVRVGRAEECELRLPAGPAHALVVARGPAGFTVRRTTGWLSLARMRVNGRPAREAAIRSGDRIELGDLRLTFLDEI
jgi:predicted component of type VI protein secretion system